MYRSVLFNLSNITDNLQLPHLVTELLTVKYNLLQILKSSLTEYFSLLYSVTEQLSLSNRKLKTCSHGHHVVVTPSTIKKPPTPKAADFP